MTDENEEHVITATEPVYVTYEMSYEDGYLNNYPGQDAEIGDVVDWTDGRGDFKCSCGEEFNRYHEAEEHMESVYKEE